MVSSRILAIAGSFALLAALAALPAAGEARFQRGDTNADGAIDISDPIAVLWYLFAQGQAPPCEDAADGNDDGSINLADAIKVLGHLFGGTGNLGAPFRTCGTDPTPDGLGCAAYPPCVAGGPRVVSSYPAGGETGVSVRTHIAIIFSTPMDTASVEAAISASPSISGEPSWDETQTILTLTLAQGTVLAPETAYTVSVAASAEDADGAALEGPFSLPFTTDLDRPAVAGVEFTVCGVSVSASTDMVVTFSKAMDTASTQAATRIEDALARIVPVTFSWNGAKTAVTIHPQSGLADGVEHTVTVGAGARDAARSLAMQAPFRFVFTPDGAIPCVTETRPADGGKATIDPRIAIAFSEPMNRSSVKGAVTVRRAGGASVSCSPSWNDDATIIALAPLAPLAADADYTVTVGTGARDLAGNGVAQPLVVSFRTDATPPAVIGTIPADGEAEVSVESAVRIRFSEPMDQESVTRALAIDPAPVDGRLAYGTAYTVTLDASAHDRAGNPLAAPFSFWFVTETHGPVALQCREVAHAPGYRTSAMIAADRGAVWNEAGDSVTVGEDALHLVFLDAEGLKYAYSPDAGHTWTPDEVVPTGAGPEQIHSRLALAVDREEGVHILYSKNDYLPDAPPGTASAWDLMRATSSAGMWVISELVNHADYDRGHDAECAGGSPLDNGLVPAGAVVDGLNYLRVLAAHEGSCAYGGPLWELTVPCDAAATKGVMWIDPICGTSGCIGGSCIGRGAAVDIDTYPADPAASVSWEETLVLNGDFELTVVALNDADLVAAPGTAAAIDVSKTDWYDYLTSFLEDPTLTLDEDLWNALQNADMDDPADDLADELASLETDTSRPVLSPFLRACIAVITHEPSAFPRYFYTRLVVEYCNADAANDFDNTVRQLACKAGKQVVRFCEEIEDLVEGDAQRAINEYSLAYWKTTVKEVVGTFITETEDQLKEVPSLLPHVSKVVELMYYFGSDKLTLAGGTFSYWDMFYSLSGECRKQTAQQRTFLNVARSVLAEYGKAGFLSFIECLYRAFAWTTSQGNTVGTSTTYTIGVSAGVSVEFFEVGVEESVSFTYEQSVTITKEQTVFGRVTSVLGKWKTILDHEDAYNGDTYENEYQDTNEQALPAGISWPSTASPFDPTWGKIGVGFSVPLTARANMRMQWKNASTHVVAFNAPATFRSWRDGAPLGSPLTVPQGVSSWDFHPGEERPAILMAHAGDLVLRECEANGSWSPPRPVLFEGGLPVTEPANDIALSRAAMGGTDSLPRGSFYLPGPQMLCFFSRLGSGW